MLEACYRDCEFLMMENLFSSPRKDFSLKEWDGCARYCHRGFIVVYLADCVEKSEGEYQLILDFFTVSDYLLFMDYFGRELQILSSPETKEIHRSVYVKIDNYKSNDTPQKGMHYYLDIWKLGKREVISVPGDNNRFPFLYSLSLLQDAQRADDPILYYIGHLSYPQWAFRSFHSIAPIPDPPADGRMELLVHDVGQGNCNEIRLNGNPYVLFDAGTLSSVGTNQFNQCVKKLEDELSANDLSLFVLSHWDIDHFSLLFSLSDACLKRFRYCIFPAHVNGLSEFLFIRSLYILGSKVAVSAHPSSVPWQQYPLNHSITLFVNKYLKSSTNNSGLNLFVKGDTNNAMLPGDCRYRLVESQVNKVLSSPMGSGHVHYLVVPHHGGAAGAFSYSIPNASRIDGIISVGPNHYRHPLPGTLSQLKSVVSKLSITNDEGDVTKEL